MIAPGSLAIYAPKRAGGKRRTVTYTRVSRRRARGAETRDTSSVLFQSHQYEFPTATLMAKQPPRAAIVRGMHAWLAARWQWLRPRTIPVAVALASMILALAATNALSDMAHTSRVEAQPMLGAHAHIVHTYSSGVVFEVAIK